MYKYSCLNPIAGIGLKNFTDGYAFTPDAGEAEAILVRSAKMHGMQFSDKLLAIARAGAGVNNIPLEECAEKGIVVFNTPGANANGVKELVIAGMLLASRDIVGGIGWVKENAKDPDIDKSAESAKKQFAGREISGKKLGIIGLGYIGQMVANCATHLGMEVYGYDPFISVDAAWNLSRSIKHIQNLDDIYRECDFITIHVPLTDKTQKMVDAAAIAKMKTGVVFLNLARDLLVDEEAMVQALRHGKVAKYVTDFANPTVANAPNTLITPHLGASTEESEDNCAVMAVNELMDYLENGNIRNSVNYPACDLGVCTAESRIAILHKNVVNMIGQFTAVIAGENVNIANMTNKSRGDYAYTLIDLESPVTDSIIEKLSSVEGIIRVRVVK
ncbi:MAG: phosphoglycerate dehydrogenase [Eubacterium sp.]|nr:phosphoglycerate dehydrogenase [Eubacterium sp.]